MKHDEVYRRGIELIRPHIHTSSRKRRQDPGSKMRLREGIVFIDMALRIDPQNWAAWWARGKALQALGDHSDAYEAFLCAHNINCHHADVGRELVAESLEVGKAFDGVRVAEALWYRYPGDASLLANLAVAYLLAERNHDSYRAVCMALSLEPNDVTTIALKQRIEEVCVGAIPQPRTLAELSKQSSKQ